MENFLNIFRAVTTLLPAVLSAVQTVETAIPAGGQGQAKLAIVENMLKNTYSQVGMVEATFEQIWPVLSGAVSSAVTVFNAAGIFKKSS